LDLSAEEGEKWIVNLIRETRMGADAKIDLEKVGITLPHSILYVTDPRTLYKLIGNLSRCTNP
jgi:translation initiation factor 3 subunit E